MEAEMKSLTPPMWWLSAGAPLPDLQVQDRVTAEERQETAEGSREMKLLVLLQMLKYVLKK